MTDGVYEIIEKLKAEVTRLKAELQEAKHNADDFFGRLHNELVSKDVEIDRLKAENIKYQLAQQGNLAKLDELNARLEKDADYQELKAEIEHMKQFNGEQRNERARNIGLTEENLRLREALKSIMTRTDQSIVYKIAKEALNINP